MAGIDRTEVERVARLARLELSEDEVTRLASELGDVLDHFDALRELDDGTSGEDPEAEGVRLRADLPGPDRLTRPPSEIAPDWRADHFVVPRLAAMRREGGGGRVPAPGEEGAEGRAGAPGEGET